MGVADDFQLSFYEEVTKISDGNKDVGSEVWLVRDTRDDRLYVMKKLKVSEQKVDETIMEYENNQKKKLVGVPQIFTMVSKEDSLTLVEEYINHPTLRKVMESETITVEELMLIFREICAVLQQLHILNPPIIHRDIKPDNIIVDMNAVRGKTSDTKLYVIDWNAAREYSAFKSRDTQLMGTFEFAAPEQLGYGQSDVRTDIFGVGATLEYCMNQMEMRSITENHSRVWSKLRLIVDKAKSLSPDDRYATDDDIVTEFDALLGVNQTRENSSKIDYTLPGFRTKKLWKMIVAIIGYIFIFITVRDIETNATSVIWKMYEKLCYLMLLMCHPLWFCNYLGVQDRFKWLKQGTKGQRRWIHIVVVIGMWGFWAMVSVLPILFGLE